MLREREVVASPAFLRCQAGGFPFCLDLADIDRIERSDRLVPGPGGPEPKGFLPAPGGRVPVWSLAGRLGLPEPIHAGVAPVLVVESLGRRWGLEVERVGRAAGGGKGEAEVSVSPLPPLAGDPRRRWFRGVVHLPEGLALHLDPERLHPDAGPDPEETPAPPLPVAPSPAGPRRARLGGGRLVLFSTSPGAGSPLRFALSLSQVLEIARPQPLLGVPGSDGSFLGLARWRGEALPVIDLQFPLGAGRSFFEGASRLLVARASRVAQVVAFPVRPEVRLAPVPRESRAASVPGVDGSLLRGTFVTDSGVILVPDLDRILSRR